MNGDGVIHIFEPQIAGILDSFFDAEARQADGKDKNLLIDEFLIAVGIGNDIRQQP